MLASEDRSGSPCQAPGASRARPALLSRFANRRVSREKKTSLRLPDCRCGAEKKLETKRFRDASNETTPVASTHVRYETRHTARARAGPPADPRTSTPLSVFITMSSPDEAGLARPEVPARSTNMVRPTKYSAESPYNDSPGTSPAPRARPDERKR